MTALKRLMRSTETVGAVLCCVWPDDYKYNTSLSTPCMQAPGSRPADVLT